MIDIPMNADFREQQERTCYKAGRSYQPCVVCGRAVREPRNMVHVHHGFATIVTEEESQELNKTEWENGDMYLFPIGPDCLKLHPEIKPYVQEMPHVKASDYKALYADLYRQCFGENASDEDVMRDAQRRLEILKHNR